GCGGGEGGGGGGARDSAGGLPPRRARRFATFCGVNDRLQQRLPSAVVRLRADHVHFAFAPVRCTRWAAMCARLRARGTTTSWDFGCAPSLRGRPGFARLLGDADFSFVTGVEAGLDAGPSRLSAAANLWRRSARNTVIKLGRHGSRWIAPAIDARAAAVRVRTVETTGAGDAFDGGFLFAFLRGAAPRDCLRAGNFVGAQSTRGAGGVAALPRSLPAGLVGQVGRAGQVSRTATTRATHLRSTRDIRPTRPTGPTRPTRP